MIEEFSFSMPVDRDWNFCSIYDLDRKYEEEYLYWENLVVELYVNFFNFFKANGSIEYAVYIKPIKMKYIDCKNNKLIDKSSIEVECNYIRKLINKNTKYISEDLVKMLAKNSARDIVYFSLVDLKSNTRLCPHWSDFFVYDLYVDISLNNLSSIFSREVIKYIDKTVFPFETPEERFLLSAFEEKTFKG